MKRDLTKEEKIRKKKIIGMDLMDANGNDFDGFQCVFVWFRIFVDHNNILLFVVVSLVTLPFSFFSRLGYFKKKKHLIQTPQKIPINSSYFCVFCSYLFGLHEINMRLERPLGAFGPTVLGEIVHIF